MRERLKTMKGFTSYFAGFAVETWDVWVGVTCWDCKKKDRKRRVECLGKRNAFTLLWKALLLLSINKNVLVLYGAHYFPWPSRYIKNSQNHMQIMSLVWNMRSCWIRERRNPWTHYQTHLNICEWFQMWAKMYQMQSA